MAHVLSSEEIICLSRCSSYSQYCHMRDQFEKGCCSFCDVDTAINTILFENESWRLWENAFPNGRGCAVMLLIAHTRHTRQLSDISKTEWGDLAEIMHFVAQKYELDGGMFFMRFGDMHLNAGTVPHLHWNLWVPDGSKELRIPVLKELSEVNHDLVRMHSFSARYEAGELPE